MSFDGPSQSGSASPGPSSSGNSRQSERPQYMTVGGSGSDAAYASHLRSLIDKDSGYGSIADGESASGGWMPESPSSFGTPDRLAAFAPDEHERRAMASHILQLQYNQNRTALARAITQTVDVLKRLQDMNAQWPAHYPTVKRPPSPSPSRPDPRPGLYHTQSTLDNHHEQPRQQRPTGLQRAGTSLGELHSRSDSPHSHSRSQSLEPRLVTPQLAQQFSVLKIELKMEGASQTELVHSLEKQSIASLLDGQINNSIRHLFSLRERIEDTASKVLVTGDLNAGKSTFCNALLRRKVLPEDQQPCTAIFCEVLDVRENGGLEEVHAVPIGLTYNRNDESTYHVFELKQLEDIVIDNERYSQCKVYVKDIRTVDQSLLNNGVVDIALIDAPGLNNDSLKTTAVFARQEEIDVVVFVVSAANHFTLSAKEFIFNAAREKAYMFMVVNGFDNIRDKKRCQEGILKQIAQLSPATFKESSELVHFVSSNAIPVAPAGQPPPSGGSGSGSSGPSGDPFGPSDDPSDDQDENTKHGSPGSPPPNNDKSKGKEKAKIDDFNELEASLRRFVLEKRARSKLAPARTYLLNVLGDLSSLAAVNRDVAGNELQRLEEELKSLEPELEKSRKARTSAGDQAETIIDDESSSVYSHTRDTLNRTISTIGKTDLGVPYPGIWSVYDYAESLKHSMLAGITRAVQSCEEHGRQRTVSGVSSIASLGLLHLGEGYQELTFKSEKMFRSRRDALARQVDVEVEIWDLFNLQALWERQEKVVGSGMAVTVAGVVGGRLFGGVGWIDSALGVAKVVGPSNMRRVLVPGLALAVILSLSYTLSSIPSTLPLTLSRKLSLALSDLDYTHSNAQRISNEVRRALSYPAARLREGLQRGVERLADEREGKRKTLAESQVARKYFSNLVREAGDVKGRVEGVDLEGTGGVYEAANA
ncbi:hypothetical protein KVT40_000914 [Elsinoe batatas]|uniref:Dynamin-type G domain-containing protein n=1 Tax=Elsinoe batatas TaxID=2601811 RepID=A0A8K0L8M8_9PEZI|nr:hypothetical protein KVT40_000914 [Elsinoe batatas]